MLITNIQRFSIHDGEGIRTTVFLKGCTLNCKWCHNPENISREKQVMHDKPVGEEYSVDDLYIELMKDEEFYIESNGGVTFSGGEPLIWSAELLPLIKRLCGGNISVNVETAGNINWENFEIISDYIDEFLFDIKCISEDLHKSGTGSSNKLILENFDKLYNLSKNIVARIPVIPGFNADEKNIADIALFLQDYKNIKYAELMPFHAIASHKYEALGLRNDYADCKGLDINSDLIKRFREMFYERHIKTKRDI
jgi:pyruvate formate lyase activating enzyme